VGTPRPVRLTKEELMQMTTMLGEIGTQSSNKKNGVPTESNGTVELSFDDVTLKNFDQHRQTLALLLGDTNNPTGSLVISHHVSKKPDAEVLRLCVELAESFVRRTAIGKYESEGHQESSSPRHSWRLPRGIEWKAHALEALQRRMMARARFVDRALHSVEDGIVVSDINGCIQFANRRAGEIFNVTEESLIGSDLFQQITRGENTHDTDQITGNVTQEMLLTLLVDRLAIEQEIVIGDAPPRYYTLRLSAVADDEDDAVSGLVASLSEITKHHELQQTKNDVMALVTHELRTPLTAIQGMSELLAEHDMEPTRRREMYLAINGEAKRLARLINNYLDIALLESGARPLRLSSARVGPLVERAILILEPLAKERRMRLTKHFAPNLPAVLIDADLIAQAVTNLVANAIKYSPPGSEVDVKLRADEDAMWIDVEDHGYGIPAGAITRIFEKFHRVPRAADPGVFGTGLGLTFVREAAEKHGGRITVESEVGIGSVFSLRLPLPSNGDLSSPD
jgi:signal transduction histidine kinase